MSDGVSDLFLPESGVDREELAASFKFHGERPSYEKLQQNKVRVYFEGGDQKMIKAVPAIGELAKGPKNDRN